MLAVDDPRHGTTYAYKTHECRCPTCTRANREHHARYIGPPMGRGEDGDTGYYHGPVLQVMCWCEASIVLVLRTALAAGLTESCGAPDCHAPTGQL